MITTHFECVGTLAEGADRTTPDLKRVTLIYAVRVLSGIADPHQFVIPGEAIPALIRLLQEAQDKYPDLTVERAKEGETHMSGVIGLGGLPPGKES